MHNRLEAFQTLSKVSFVFNKTMSHPILLSTLFILFLTDLQLNNQALAEDRFIPPGFFDDLNSLSLDEIPHYDELPVHVRREVPRPKLSVHYYDDDPNKRYALVNHYRAYEGLPIGRELWVYQIVPDGIVIKYVDRYFFVEK